MNKIFSILLAVALVLVALNLVLLTGIVEKKTAHAAESKKNSANKMCPIPVTPKPDPCRQYHEKALEQIQKLEKENFSAVILTSFASASTAYSLLYQNCRDFERQK